MLTTNVLLDFVVSLKEIQVFVIIFFIQTLDVICTEHFGSFNFQYYTSIDSKGGIFVQPKVYCNILLTIWTMLSSNTILDGIYFMLLSMFVFIFISYDTQVFFLVCMYVCKKSIIGYALSIL